MFYTYRQNNDNAGGRLVDHPQLAQYVVIEAHSLDQADGIAERLGMDFTDQCPPLASLWPSPYEEMHVVVHYLDVPPVRLEVKATHLPPLRTL